MSTETTSTAKARTAVPARPLRRDAELNRQRLLEAAQEVFAELGFEATMDQIAARAGVGVGTAYRRFANKEELIAALFEDRLADLIAVADEALAEVDPWRGVIAYMEGSISLQAGDRGFKELVLSSPRSREYVAKARAQLKPRIDELIERAQRAGCLRPGIESTDLVVVQLMLAAIYEPARGASGEHWRRFLPLVIDGLGRQAGEPLPGKALSVEELDEVMERR
jgi:AcrR family transcriptional regulator